MSLNSFNPISLPQTATEPDVPNCSDGIDQENLEMETQESLISRLQNAVKNEEKFGEVEVKRQSSETIFSDMFGEEIDLENNIELCKGNFLRSSECKIVTCTIDRDH